MSVKMAKKLITEVDYLTGEEITREMTLEEITQWEADRAEQASIEAAATLRAEAKAALLAKLGITEDEAKLLLG